MEVGQLIQLCDVVPAGVCQPAGTGVVHLFLLIEHLETHPSINQPSNHPSISVSINRLNNQVGTGHWLNDGYALNI